MKLFLSTLIVLIVIHQQSISGKPAKKRQLSFALPGLSLLPGGAGGNLFGGGTVTRTVLRTVSTVTLATAATCTSLITAVAPLILAPCSGRKKRDNDAVNKADQIEPTLTLQRGTELISDPIQIARLLDYSSQAPAKKSSGAIADPETSTIFETTTTFETLYPTPTDEVAIFDDEGVTEIDTTPAQTPLGEFWNEVNDGLALDPKEADTGKKGQGRFAFGTTTTSVVTVSVTGIAYTLASGLTLRVTYSGCSPASPAYTGSVCPP